MDLCDAKKRALHKATQAGARHAAPPQRVARSLAGVAFFFRVEEFGEARIFLQERQRSSSLRAVKAIFVLRTQWRLSSWPCRSRASRSQDNRAPPGVPWIWIRFGRGFARLD